MNFQGMFVIGKNINQLPIRIRNDLLLVQFPVLRESFQIRHDTKYQYDQIRFNRTNVFCRDQQSLCRLLRAYTSLQKKGVPSLKTSSRRTN